MRKFDLNIERILENWKPYHAVREFIANALDEQLLTDSKDIAIYKSDGIWHIRDYGRGLKYAHLTQNENEEKLNNPHVIGRFGIGLKDAIATLYRHDIMIEITSKYGVITIEKSAKQDFADIKTLHAIIEPATDIDFVGTDIAILGINDEDIYSAKKLFLKFAEEVVLGKSKYGEIIKKKAINAAIYINGVKVAEEENFLFSYNITTITAQIKKSINRERTNVGRSAYSESVKKIILTCNDESVINILQDDFLKIDTGDAHDEMKWIDIQEYVTKFINRSGNVLFVDTQQILDNTNLIDEAKESGFQIVPIPTNLVDKIQDKTDMDGNRINDLSSFVTNRNENFEYQYISLDALLPSEREIFNKTDQILSIANIHLSYWDIQISENMQKNYDFIPAKGVCNYADRTIIIKRSELTSVSSYTETLIHEAIHATTGYEDVSRIFESALSKTIGILCGRILEEKSDTLTQKSWEQKDKFETLTKPLEEKFVNEELLSVIDTLKTTIKWDKLQKAILYLVIFPTIPVEYYHLYKGMPHIYDDYLKERKENDWISDIPTAIRNLEYLYSLPLMSEKEFESIYEHVKIVDYIHYKELYKQAKRIGLDLTQKTIYSFLTIQPNGVTIKHIYNTYKYLRKKYKEAKEKLYHTKIGQ